MLSLKFKVQEYSTIYLYLFNQMPASEIIYIMQSFLILYFPHSEQKEFRTIITVQGVLGEMPLVLKVIGSGSFDESFVSPISDT